MNKRLSAMIVTVFSLFVLSLSVSAQAVSELEEGTYSIDFLVVKAGENEQSMMNDYVEKPGTLTVRDGKAYVSFTLTDSKSITGFKVNQNGVLTDANVISQNEAANTRSVEFEVTSFAAPIEAWVSVYMNLPGFLYDADYDIRIQLDETSIRPATPSSPPPSAQPNGDVIVLHINSKAVTSNGAQHQLLAAPYVKSNRTLVPLRFISEHLGADVKWNGSERSVTVTVDGKTLVLHEGSQVIQVNGARHTIEAAPEIKQGTTFVPLRFISEQLGATVEWNQTQQRVTIRN
ncbi:stalk domain-containing protein [Alkalihalobacillus oceani]|uniref:Stalk domain-containing protein n=1 Tax=Halalkalibacter oceani TaxID=1653776 RepID=A0A9X2IMM7_9BACI|nr:stalk domain-containing protein [Halalkalibacter oceani]MCM3714049.1 stalk domain-containing protein [Halalkalibacter oceani]